MSIANNNLGIIKEADQDFSSEDSEEESINRSELPFKLNEQPNQVGSEFPESIRIETNQKKNTETLLVFNSYNQTNINEIEDYYQPAELKSLNKKLVYDKNN